MAEKGKTSQKTRGKPTVVDIHVGDQVRKRRNKLQWSQERLAGHLDLTFQQVQKYEKGTNRVGAGRLYQLAEVLGVPIAYFFEGLDPEDLTPMTIDPVPDQESRQLVEAYAAIANPEIRKQVLALMRVMGSSEGEE